MSTAGTQVSAPTMQGPPGTPTFHGRAQQQSLEPSQMVRHEHFCNVFRALDQHEATKHNSAKKPHNSKQLSILSTPTNAEAMNSIPSLSPSYNKGNPQQRRTKASTGHFSFSAYSVDGTHTQREPKSSSLDNFAKSFSQPQPADSNANMLLLCAAAAVGAAREDTSIVLCDL